jgi:hypothetical protein
MSSTNKKSFIALASGNKNLAEGRFSRLFHKNKIKCFGLFLSNFETLMVNYSCKITDFYGRKIWKIEKIL